MILDGGSPCEHTQFPIYDTRTNNKGNLRQVTIQPQIRRADIWAALEAAQPYQNVAPTKTELSIISTLNNHDKHRLLLTVAGVLNVDENPLSYSLAEGVAPPKSASISAGSPMALPLHGSTSEGRPHRLTSSHTSSWPSPSWRDRHHGSGCGQCRPYWEVYSTP